MVNKHEISAQINPNYSPPQKSSFCPRQYQMMLQTIEGLQEMLSPEEFDRKRDLERIKTIIESLEKEARGV